MMSWVIVWTLFALIGFLIGNTRGRGGMGAALGFFLGPVGWILAARLRDPRAMKLAAESVRPEVRLVRDPFEEFEMQERTKLPPAVPEHLKGRAYDELP